MLPIGDSRQRLYGKVGLIALREGGRSMSNVSELVGPKQTTATVAATSRFPDRRWSR